MTCGWRQCATHATDAMPGPKASASVVQPHRRRTEVERVRRPHMRVAARHMLDMLHRMAEAGGRRLTTVAEEVTRSGEARGRLLALSAGAGSAEETREVEAFCAFYAHRAEIRVAGADIVRALRAASARPARSDAAPRKEGAPRARRPPTGDAREVMWREEVEESHSGIHMADDRRRLVRGGEANVLAGKTVQRPWRAEEWRGR